MRSATSGAAFSYKRENSQRGNSYKRDSNSPLRSKERIPDTIGSNKVGMRTVGVNELDQKYRDKTPPTRLVQEPVRDYQTYSRPSNFGGEIQPPERSTLQTQDLRKSHSPSSPLRQKSGSRSPIRSRDRDSNSNAFRNVGGYQGGLTISQGSAIS